MTTPVAPPMLAMTDLPLTDAVMRDLFGPEAEVGPSGDPQRANEVTAPNLPETDDLVEPIERYRALMAALYGSDFPLIDAFDRLTSEDPAFAAEGRMPTLEQMLPLTEASAWATWVRGRWTYHAAAVQQHLYLVARNRLFRAGHQWVSSRGNGPWTTPTRPAETARVVHNVIGPALDQRIQVITEQRPSFQVDPSALSPDEKRKAEGRQQALEFQYDGQHMQQMTQEASYWAGTDGVAFWEVYWDRDAGPWDQRMSATGAKKPLGDLRTKTRRCDQVRVSANATSTEPPYYLMVRDVIPETEAAYVYGASGVQPGATQRGAQHDDRSDAPAGQGDSGSPSWVLTQTIVGEGFRMSNVNTVERFTMYVDRHPDVLPEGLQLTVLDHSVVWGPGELLFGMIPVVPVRDGSTDPSFYPRPIMEQWVAPQMRINAALSLWVNSVRVNSGGRFLAKPDAVSRETFMGSGLSIIEVEAPGPIGEALQPVQGFLVGPDVKDLIAFDTKAFEDMSGYNDVSRGQVSNETATAVAAANEQITRVFTPPVAAVANAMTIWAKVNLAGMAWGYDIPRDVGAVGADRPDLARALSAKDFEGPSTVIVDAEKMLPMPKVYRLQIMDDWFNRGLISGQQYMRNVKFGSFKNLSTPDEDQDARAKRIADAIRNGQQLPMADPADPNAAAMTAQLASQPLAIRWSDNEAIHQDVLERDILLHDDLDAAIIDEASKRWKLLAAQAALKGGAMGGGAPAGPGGPPAPGGGPPEGAPPGAGPVAGPMTAPPGPPPPAPVPAGGPLASPGMTVAP